MRTATLPTLTLSTEKITSVQIGNRENLFQLVEQSPIKVAVFRTLRLLEWLKELQWGFHL